MEHTRFSVPLERMMLVPKPVQTRSITTHGFFDMTNLKHHMMSDEKWTPLSLTEQFHGVTSLMKRRMAFKRLEDKNRRENKRKHYERLKHQCHEGYAKLRYVLHEETAKEVSAMLIHDKGMQRLYSSVPLHMVNEKINQRTFVLRKERDRLQYTLDQYKQEYSDVLLQSAKLESRITYENVFVLKVVHKSLEYRKEIENSNIRLSAIQTINSTYKKILQVLSHDTSFYEPILESLGKDIEDQGKFIKYVKFLSDPAEQILKELGDDFKKLDDKTRKSNRNKLLDMARYNRDMQKSPGGLTKLQRDEDVHKTSQMHAKRYLRETQSMEVLKTRLQYLDKTVKFLKFKTLCSNARRIYPRMKAQEDKNRKLRKVLEKDQLGYSNIMTKLQRSEVLTGVLTHNLTKEEVRRLERAELLKKACAVEDLRTTRVLRMMENRSKAIVLLRFSLWNLNEILKFVDRPARPLHVPYPDAFLKLPLLKFENYNMRACPPEQYEENVDTMMATVRRKATLLSTAFKQGKYDAKKIQRYNKIYTDMYEDALNEGDELDSISKHHDVEIKEEDPWWVENMKSHEVPNRTLIKERSCKIHEEAERKKLE